MLRRTYFLHLNLLLLLKRYESNEPGVSEATWLRKLSGFLWLIAYSVKKEFISAAAIESLVNST